ncbi:MAG: hypothetical protein RL701_7903 [Pseudomonadota bacterium]|jgi:all-trans-retinol dehydrogenase (NAD+)
MPSQTSYYRGKRVLITGAGAGLGQNMARLIAEQGGELVLWDINEAGLKATAAALSNAERPVTSYVCDVSDPAVVKQVAARVKDDGGPIDILINNAGVVSGKLLLDLTDRDIQRTFGVNAFALFWTTREFLPSMLERHAGHIVTIASAAGVVATVRQTDYAASKHAAVGFDEALRCELRHLGQPNVLTTVVCPYYVATGMFDGAKASSPLLPVADPERIAQQIVTGISRGRRRLFLPPVVAASYVGRVLNTALFDGIMRVLGVTHSMDTFKGRGAAQPEVARTLTTRDTTP